MKRRTRKFHPIGQGAFYTERHSDKNGSEFNIVFDCGSETKDSKKRFEEIIKEEFSKPDKADNIIDILFISHFHADHINQIDTLIKYCTIKNVVIPLLDEETKTLLKIENYLENEFEDTGLIDDPYNYFNRNSTTRIIGINRRNINDDNQENINNRPILDISEITNEYIQGIIEAKSGIKIISSKIEIDWFYIPYNYNYKENNRRFIKKLRENSIELTDINTLEKIKEKKKILIECYEEIDGDLNNISMILYSGNNKQEDIYCYRPYSCRCFYSCTSTGCIYFGDIKLIEEITDDIVKVFSFLKSSIQTIQIPHHGSKENKIEKLLPFLDNLRCAIISYGTTNKHKHPSQEVINILNHYSVYSHLITERKHSGFSQDMLSL